MIWCYKCSKVLSLQAYLSPFPWCHRMSHGVIEYPGVCPGVSCDVPECPMDDVLVSWCVLALDPYALDSIHVALGFWCWHSSCVSLGSVAFSIRPMGLQQIKTGQQLTNVDLCGPMWTWLDKCRPVWVDKAYRSFLGITPSTPLSPTKLAWNIIKHEFRMPHCKYWYFSIRIYIMY